MFASTLNKIWSFLVAHHRRIILGLLVAACVGTSSLNLPLGQLTSINVGAALIPALIALGLIVHCRDEILPIVVTLVITIGTGAVFSQVVAEGITAPTLSLTVITAFVSLVVAPSRPAMVAYIAGTLGGLIGIDFVHGMDAAGLLNSGDQITHLTIGGAGIGDGIFLIGPMSAFFASAGARWLGEEPC